MADTRQHFERLGYKFLAYGNCRQCHTRMEWWQMRGTAKLALDLPRAEGAAGQLEDIVKHFEHCKGPAAPAPKRTPHTRAPQTDARRAELARQTAIACREALVKKLALTTRARVVVALYGDGYCTQWRTDIPPDDLAHELITEANRIRREATKEKEHARS